MDFVSCGDGVGCGVRGGTGLAEDGVFYLENEKRMNICIIFDLEERLNEVLMSSSWKNVMLVNRNLKEHGIHIESVHL